MRRVVTRGYCVEWDVPTPAPQYAWRFGVEARPRVLLVNLGYDIDDLTIYADFGLERRPKASRHRVAITWECADGRTTFNFRWVVAATPGNLGLYRQGPTGR